MISQSCPGFDPENFVQLRIVGKAICQDLRREIIRVENGGVEFDELKELYESIYQPKATALVWALLPYVPENDPRITVTFQMDAARQVTRSADVDSVSQCLHPGYTAAQLKEVVKILTELLDLLPSKI